MQKQSLHLQKTFSWPRGSFQLSKNLKGFLQGSVAALTLSPLYKAFAIQYISSSPTPVGFDFLIATTHPPNFTHSSIISLVLLPSGLSVLYSFATGLRSSNECTILFIYLNKYNEFCSDPTTRSSHTRIQARAKVLSSPVV